jgi:hypothetical protein
MNSHEKWIVSFLVDRAMLSCFDFVFAVLIQHSWELLACVRVCALVRLCVCIVKYLCESIHDT